MAGIDQHRGVAAMAQHLLESTSATAAETTSADDDDDDGGGCFTFAAASPLMAAGGEFAEGHIISPVYPVFGRPRSPPLPEQQQQEEDSTSATVRVPLALLLLEERGSPPSPSGQAPDDDGELDGVPAETYCLWSPGASPSPARSQSPAARCVKSGSTGSVLWWRQRLLLLGRSSSDGKEKFVFVDTRSERDADGGRDGWRGSHRGRDDKGGVGNGGRPSFLPDKMDLVGLFAKAGAFRRSYHPF